MRIFLLFLFVITCQLAFGQHDVRINTPQDGEEFFPGDVFVHISISNKYPITKLQFLLDAQDISAQFREVPKAVTALLRQPLIPGTHFLRVNLKTDSGLIILTESKFKVIRLKGADDPSKGLVKSDKKKFLGDVWALTGNIIAETRQTVLEGKGKDLRQEPSQTNFLFLNTALVHKHIRIPLKMTLSTDENTFQPNVQSRNFFQTGIQTKHLEVLVGDLNPSFDRLLFSGTRVRGIQGGISYPRFKATFLYGELNRALEGQKFTYNPSQGFVPPNLNSDSTYILPGIYKRMVMALRVEMGNTVSKNAKTGITIMKAKDDTSSIRFGQNPKDNLGANLDHTRFFWKKRIRLGFGLSGTLITSNTFLGVERKSRIDSVLETNFPIEPRDVARLLVINASTTYLSEAVFAGYANLSLKVLRQDLFFEFMRIGSSYESLANPFMRNDQQQFLFTDRFDLFKRRIFVNLRYFNLRNNLAGTQLSTINNHSASTNITYSPGVGKPQIFTNMLFQSRLSTGNNLSITGNTDDRTLNLSVGASWNVNLQGIDNFLSVQYNMTQRNDWVRTGNDNSLNAWGVIFSQRYSFPLQLEINYNASRIDFVRLASNNNQSDSWLGMLGYENRKAKLTTSLGAGRNNMVMGDGVQDTKREQYFIRLAYKGIKGFQLDIEGGLSPFTNRKVADSQYSEKYFFTRLTYNLGGRNLASW